MNTVQKCFKHGNYEIFPTGQQILNEDGSTGDWMALASIIYWKGNDVLSMPVSWYPPLFATQQDATTHAANAAKEMIDMGRCNFS